VKFCSLTNRPNALELKAQENLNPNKSTMDVTASSHCRDAGIGDDGIA
jgi:hypothetical protein